MFRTRLDFGFPEYSKFQFKDDGSEHYTPVGGESPPIEPEPELEPEPHEEPAPEPELEPEPKPELEPDTRPPTADERIASLEVKYKEQGEELRRTQEESTLTRQFLDRQARPPSVQAEPELPPWHWNAADAEKLALNPDSFIEMSNEKARLRDAYYDQEMDKRTNDRVNQATTQETLRKTFYTKHEDLIGKEPVVQMVAQKVYLENPRANPADILDKIADATRAQLKEWGVVETKPRARTTSKTGRARTRAVKPGEKTELEKTLEYQLGRQGG